GRNHYPQDIEETAQNAHPALRPSCVAAFRVEVEDEEQLAIVAEVDRQRYQEWKQAGSPAAAFVETLEAIRLAVAEAHDLQAHTLVLIKPGTIPKTTSGKIRRSHCRELWLKGGLELVDHATGPQLLQALARKPAPPEAQTPRTATEQTVATIWQEVLGLKHVGFRERFVELGGESVTAAHVLHRVNEHFGLRLSLEEAFAAHTVEELAALIERHRPASASDAPALRRQVTHEL
ncbi:MAG: phosphopantetheine-binding protein, partial [Archangium sp.]